jgi:hypothetical protein
VNDMRRPELQNHILLKKRNVKPQRKFTWWKPSLPTALTYVMCRASFGAVCDHRTTSPIPRSQNRASLRRLVCL